MQEQHLFEYAVIRIVPRVEREEFVNAGVVLYCRPQKFLDVLFVLDEDRLRALDPELDIAEVKEYLCAFERICKGAPGSGPIGLLDMPSRFRWLTAARSTVVQCSRVHPGLCTDASATIRKLLEQLVL